MTPEDFIAKWTRVALTERSAAQQHFLDLCQVLDHPPPAEADPTGESFTFERGAKKHGGGDGWADVWKRGFFGWEYKGRHKNLNEAYDQLLLYREALENPPLLVVCDMDRIVVHTNFTATAALVHEIPLKELGKPRNLEILRNLFHEPHKLRPGVTSERVTEEAASRLAEVAQSLRGRGLDPAHVARFLDRIVFCLFAEDVRLLPEDLFTRVVNKSNRDPVRFTKLVGQLFDAMAAGGDFGLDTIRHFNGNLFDDSPILELTVEEMDAILAATKLDWTAIDPSILGTLFERGMDPAKRSQLGAHYTSREDIETLVEPVVMTPLRREWEETRQLVRNLLATGKKNPKSKPKKAPSSKDMKKARSEADALIRQFHGRLWTVKVLDPACGSGNFLYVTLQKLKDLEKEVILFAAENGFTKPLPQVGPWQLYGIEMSPYAFDLAQLTVWLGYLQWIRANGFDITHDPVLRPMNNFFCQDAILDLSDPKHPKEPAWPTVDFIVGNPPFLGGKKMRSELGDEYVEAMFELWDGRVPAEADYCCYWFEKSRGAIEGGACRRAGLLATQGIRGGASRQVLKRIKKTGDIFFAESDRPWILDGANVHVSMVGFDDGTDTSRHLDSQEVAQINPNLAAKADITRARRLASNLEISYMGTTKGGSFDIDESLALSLLHLPNPNGRANSDVVVPWINGLDITRRSQNKWIIDFGTEAVFGIASQYESPFKHVEVHVRPERVKNNRESYRQKWWLHVETRPAMRSAMRPLGRFLVTVRVSKHRLFRWFQCPTLPDSATFCFANETDYFFGVLHSRVHEIWALKLGTRLETRPRDTPTTCFETFPFPEPTDAQREAIAAAAKELDQLRNQWLNPPEWTREEVLEFPGSADGPWARYVHDPDSRGIGTVRYPRMVAKDAEAAKKLAKRTLTNLYNERPTWLDLAHRRLDEAVLAAYGWPAEIADEELLARLLELNLHQARQ